MNQGKISFWYIFFSHHPYSELNRTIKLKFANRNFHICARCTGQYVFFVLFSLFVLLFKIKHWPTAIIYILPLPATLDWLTQAIKLRESNNVLRVLSGSLFGIWLSISLCCIMQLNSRLLFHLSITCLLYFVSVVVVFLIKKGSLDEYLKPYEEFVELYEQQMEQSS